MTQLAVGGSIVVLVDEVDLAASTYYYPSAAGEPAKGVSYLSLRYVITGGVTLTIEAAQDPDGDTAQWVNITQGAYDVGTDAKGNASYISDLDGILNLDKLNVMRWRVKIVTSDATNGVYVTAKQVEAGA